MLGLPSWGAETSLECHVGGKVLGTPCQASWDSGWNPELDVNPSPRIFMTGFRLGAARSHVGQGQPPVQGSLPTLCPDTSACRHLKEAWPNQWRDSTVWWGRSPGLELSPAPARGSVVLPMK